jgi:transposase
MNIISAYRQVGTYRGAAELCGTTHKTVKRVVERVESDGPPPRSSRPRNFDTFTDLVATRIKASSGRISAKRLLPVARAAGYEGSARNFRRLVAEQKVLWRKANAHTRRPAVWIPGEYLVMDWAEAAPGLFVFCAVLAYSRWRFVRFAADQKASTTLAMLAEALAAIGGVPAKVLADRMGCLKGGVVANVVVPTPDYVRFASHYGFSPDFCHGADPQSKGIVENLCGYSQSDLAVPLLTEAAITGGVVGLRDGTLPRWHGASRSTLRCIQRSARFLTNGSARSGGCSKRCRRCGSRSAQVRCAARWIACRVFATARPATRCPPAWSVPRSPSSSITVP